MIFDRAVGRPRGSSDPRQNRDYRYGRPVRYGAAFSLVLLAPLIAQVGFDGDVAPRRRGNPVYRVVFDFWIKIFAVSFGMGVGWGGQR